MEAWITIEEPSEEHRRTGGSSEYSFLCHWFADQSRKIDDSFKKIVLTKDMVQSYYDDYGILTVNIYDFLLDPQFLKNKQYYKGC